MSTSDTNAATTSSDGSPSSLSLEEFKECFLREPDFERGVMTKTHDRRVVDEDTSKESDEFRFCDNVMRNILSIEELETIVKAQQLENVLAQFESAQSTSTNASAAATQRRDALVRTLVQSGKNIKSAMIGCLGKRQTPEIKPILMMLSVPTFPHPDPIFSQLTGVRRGNNVWRRTGYAVGYLVADVMEYRWLFSTTQLAAQYLSESKDRLSDKAKLGQLGEEEVKSMFQLTGKDPIVEAATENGVFADLSVYANQLAPAVPVYTVNILFRVGPVVSQLYLSLLIVEGKSAPCLPVAAGLARKAAFYIKRALAHDPVPTDDAAINPTGLKVIHSIDVCHNPSCSRTKEQNKKLWLCSRCKAVKYCSADCQRAHYKVHKPHCK